MDKQKQIIRQNKYVAENMTDLQQPFQKARKKNTEFTLRKGVEP